MLRMIPCKVLNVGVPCLLKSKNLKGTGDKAKVNFLPRGSRAAGYCSGGLFPNMLKQKGLE